MFLNKPDVIFKEEEKRLIAACLERNRTSQARLYNIYAQKMLIVCLRYAKNREEAEEILQDGFIKVFRNLHQFKFEGSFEGWIKKIMIHCSLRKYRDQLHLHPVLSLEDCSIDNTEDVDIISNLTSKELLNLIQKLPPACRIVFNLFSFDGLKHREIASLLHISEGTSKSNLSDARVILKRSIRLIYKIAK